MENKVIITAFSGEKIISRKEISLHSYYDDSHPEFDDCDHIKQHNIDMVELHIYSDDDHIMARNHYDQNGDLYKFETWENGEYKVEEV